MLPRAFSRRHLHEQYAADSLKLTEELPLGDAALWGAVPCVEVLALCRTSLPRPVPARWAAFPGDADTWGGSRLRLWCS